jgi:hypothetical protein
MRGEARRRRSPGGWRAGSVLSALPAALALVATLALGCSRHADFSGMRGDSTRVVSPDSLTALARGVQDRWDSGAGEDAAKLTAQLLATDLSAHPDAAWQGRSRTLLDSLAIGADILSAPGVQIVNLFSRADPDGGSWPYLVWTGEKKVHTQPLDGNGLHLSAMVARGVAPGDTRSAAVAALFGRRSGMGQQPLVMVWAHAHKDDPWNLTQTLGADSLGAIGTGEFVARDTTVDLVTRSYGGTRGFDECPTCPHVYRTRRFAWHPDGFIKLDDAEATSPYVSFVHLIQALTLDDTQLAQRWMPDGSLVDRARKLDWGHGKGTWRVAPETDENSQEMVFFRGREEAYRVQFTQRGHDWVISNFDLTTRSIE